MTKCRISDGSEIMVDAQDVPLVLSHKWRQNYKGYIGTTIRVGDGRKNVKLHRLILSAKPGEFVDHIDHNPANNIRANLRICTARQNNFNRVPVKRDTSTSQYKGVSRNYRKWIAEIRIDGKKKGLGSFETEREAAIAYDRAAQKHQGEFAYLNFPQKEAQR